MLAPFLTHIQNIHMAHQFLIIYYDNEPKLWDVYGNIVESLKSYEICQSESMIGITHYQSHRQLFVHYYSFPPTYFLKSSPIFSHLSFQHVASKIGLDYTPPSICNPAIIRQMAEYLNVLLSERDEEDNKRISFVELTVVINKKLQIEPSLLWHLLQCILDVSEFDWIYAKKPLKDWLSQIRVKF